MKKESISQSEIITSEMSAKDVLQKLTLKYLKDAHGKVEIYKSGRMEFWKINKNMVKPYFYADRNYRVFVTGLSKANIENIMQENSCIMAVDYSGYLKDIITIYFIEPELILEHYVNAGVNKKAGSNEWHVSINHTEDELVLIRSKKDPINIPIDNNNYYVQYQITEEEFIEMDAALGTRDKRKVSKKKPILKLVVSSGEEINEFTNNSPIILAVLSILIQSSKLTLEEIYSSMATYEIVIAKAQPMKSLNSILTELMKIGAVACNSKNKYKINKDVVISVIRK